jgi:uncharacterized metal-binding protein YceD (DUF177 family)
MKTPTPEFSRPFEAARVSPIGSHEVIKADARECEALALRLKLPAVHGVSARLVVSPWRGGGLKVAGQIAADIEQVSVVSLEQFRAQESFEAERYFLPHVEDGNDDEVDVIQGGVIDLGEIVAETIALELEPYPRKPGEVFEEFHENGETPSAKISPFAVLKRQKPEKP